MLKPARGRPCVPALLVSGTVPAFTCDCLHFVCAFMRRRKFDLCVSTSSRRMLRSKKTSVARVAHVLLLRSVAGYRGREYTGVQTCRVDRKRSDCSKAPLNPQKVDLCLLASFSCREYAAEAQERKVRHVAGLRRLRWFGHVVRSIVK